MTQQDPSNHAELAGLVVKMITGASQFCRRQATDCDASDIAVVEELIASACAEVERCIELQDFSEDIIHAEIIKHYKTEEFAEQGGNIGRYLLGRLVDITARRDLFLAQSFMLAAARQGFYSLHDKSGNVIATSLVSIPCFIENSFTIAIPFRLSDAQPLIFIVANEFWGHPCAVVDFGSRTYFTDQSSPKLRPFNIINGIHNIIASIVAWTLLTTKPAQDTHLPSIILGGSPNPSHSLWNYIGGLDLLQDFSKPKESYAALMVTDLIFPSPYPYSYHDVSRLSAIEKYVYINNTSCFGSDIWIRLSDAGFNPRTSRLIIEHIHEALTISDSQVCCSQLNPESSHNIDSIVRLAANRNSTVRLVVTLRAGRRKVSNQVTWLSELIDYLVNVIGQMELVLDASTASLRNITIRNAEIQQAELLIAQDRIQERLSDGSLSVKNLVGASIGEQLLNYARCDAFLTYTSGGNAKFTGFLRQFGVAIGPDSKAVRREIFSLDQCRNMHVRIPALLSSLVPDASFFIPHDRVAYSAKLTPLLIHVGEQRDAPSSSSIENTPSLDGDFNSDFLLPIVPVARSLIASIVVNLMSMSIV